MEKQDRIKELVSILSEAARAYYQEDREIMSNLEYDALYDELEALEKETGIVLAGSPTVRVGYEVLSELEKINHDSPMLSLDKTKSPEALQSWLGDKKAMLSWKMDGLTVVLTYRNGKLFRAVTRGNGITGEVITNNARVFKNLPSAIPFQGELILRGEAVIKYSDFRRINQNIENVDARYKNPRNLCSGSVRQLNNKITAERNVFFFAFAMVHADGREAVNSVEENMCWLSSLGFDVVPYEMVTKDTILQAVERFAGKITENDFPSDGLVLIYDDIAYGEALGTTAKFPRNAIAFKWKDEEAETVLRQIEWSPSRTGLINPVAIFDPVELEGTTVSRASVHNISVMRELALGIGDKIKVYKANMIIPQIAENITKSNNVEIPDSCPVCGGKTTVKEENGVKTLNCVNPECLAKHIKRLTLFVSRDAMNIEGLSEATIEKFVAEGMIKEMADVFRLERFRERIVEMEGFGEKSFENLIASVNKARKTTPERLLYGLGIPGIGKANARLIARACGGSWEEIQSLDEDRLVAIEGIGDIMAAGFVKFFREQKNTESVKDILREVTLDETIEKTGSTLTGKTFVITGSLEHFANRDELKDRIEKAGGKVAGSVSSKTSYLINNDLLSTSGKNKKAKELGIEIIDEETIMAWLK